MDIKWIGCNENNYMNGRNGNNPEVIIIHWIAGTLASCDITFQNPDRQASAHYGIANDIIHQYVKEEDTSFNCGVWEWNLKSISIEHEASPENPLSEESYQTSGKLVKEICDRYGIPLDREHIKGHNEIKPTQCPGTINIDKIIEIAKGDNMDKLDVAKSLCRARTGKLIDSEVNYIISEFIDKNRPLEDYSSNNILRDNHIPALWKSTTGEGCPISEIDYWQRVFINNEAEILDLAGTWYHDHVLPLKDKIQQMIDNPIIKEVIKEVTVEVPVEKIVEKEVKVPEEDMTNWELSQVLIKRIINGITKFFSKNGTDDQTK